MQAHVIKDGKIVNTIEVESLDALPGLHLEDASAGGVIGDSFDAATKTYTTPAADLDATRKRLSGEIEAKALAVFTKPVTLARVYEVREQQAIAFRDAGFVGEPGEYIKNFAEPAGMTYQDAANLVLQQAANLRPAQDQLEALRMRKYEVLRAPTVADAEAIAAEVMAGIATIAASI